MSNRLEQFTDAELAETAAALRSATTPGGDYSVLYLEITCEIARRRDLTSGPRWDLAKVIVERDEALAQVAWLSAAQGDLEVKLEAAEDALPQGMKPDAEHSLADCIGIVVKDRATNFKAWEDLNSRIENAKAKLEGK